MSDFSLMDAIECGIVKLPRVPVADNIPGGDMPMFRNLWEHIRGKMPKKGGYMKIVEGVLLLVAAFLLAQFSQQLIGQARRQLGV